MSSSGALSVITLTLGVSLTASGCSGEGVSAEPRSAMVVITAPDTVPASTVGQARARLIDSNGVEVSGATFTYSTDFGGEFATVSATGEIRATPVITFAPGAFSVAARLTNTPPNVTVSRTRVTRSVQIVSRIKRLRVAPATGDIASGDTVPLSVIAEFHPGASTAPPTGVRFLLSSDYASLLSSDQLVTRPTPSLEPLLIPVGVTAEAVWSDTTYFRILPAPEVVRFRVRPRGAGATDTVRVETRQEYVIELIGVDGQVLDPARYRFMRLFSENHVGSAQGQGPISEIYCEVAGTARFSVGFDPRIGEHPEHYEFDVICIP